jgi:hypothetical protein
VWDIRDTDDTRRVQPRGPGYSTARISLGRTSGPEASRSDAARPMPLKLESTLTFPDDVVELAYAL